MNIYDVIKKPIVTEKGVDKKEVTATMLEEFSGHWSTVPRLPPRERMLLPMNQRFPRSKRDAYLRTGFFIIKTRERNSSSRRPGKRRR